MKENPRPRFSIPLETLPRDVSAQDPLGSTLPAWAGDLVPGGIFTTDNDLRITSWNQWLETHARLKREQVLAKPLVEIIPSLMVRRLDHCYRDALRGESILLSRSLHGYLMPLPPTVPCPWFAHMQQSARIGPLVVAGSICGTVTLIEDVTEREWHERIVRQARQRSELLTRILARLLTARDPDHLVRELFSQVAGPLHLDWCLHHALEPHTQRLQFYSADGLPTPEAQQPALLEAAQGLCHTILQTRQRLVVEQFQGRTGPDACACKGLGLAAFAGFPLLSGSRLLGSLAFGSRSRESFPEEEVQFLFSLSQYAALALDRAQQEDKLRASEERFRNMAATVPDIIFTATPDGSRDYINSRFYEVTGLAPESGLGFGWMQALDPRDHERVQQGWQRCVQTGEPFSLEYRLRTHQGQTRWFVARARPICDEAHQLMKWFGTVTDIQELKQAHQELAQAQAQLAEHAAGLEQAVQERTAELRETVSQLESFSYTVAHDLRAPIRTIENYANVLLEDYGERLQDQAKTLLGNMSRAARRLDALTRDVLNYTKLATQKVQLVPVDPVEILQDVLALNPALQTPNAEVAIVRPIPLVLAHPTFLSQCLSNLLSNAVKFVRPGVLPHVVIGSELVAEEEPAPASAAALEPAGRVNGTVPKSKRCERSLRQVRLWVQDNGMGMDREMRAKAFGIFERGRGMSQVPGTGIGLAIVAKAVERMGGTCGVESQPETGSRFWIQLTAA